MKVRITTHLRKIPICKKMERQIKPGRKTPQKSIVDHFRKEKIISGRRLVRKPYISQDHITQRKNKQEQKQTQTNKCNV